MLSRLSQVTFFSCFLLFIAVSGIGQQQPFRINVSNYMLTIDHQLKEFSPRSFRIYLNDSMAFDDANGANLQAIDNNPRFEISGISPGQYNVRLEAKTYRSYPHSEKGSRSITRIVGDDIDPIYAYISVEQTYSVSAQGLPNIIQFRRFSEYPSIAFAFRYSDGCYDKSSSNPVYFESDIYVDGKLLLFNQNKHTETGRALTKSLYISQIKYPRLAKAFNQKEDVVHYHVIFLDPGLHRIKILSYATDTSNTYHSYDFIPASRRSLGTWETSIDLKNRAFYDDLRNQANHRPAYGFESTEMPFLFYFDTNTARLQSKQRITHDSYHISQTRER